MLSLQCEAKRYAWGQPGTVSLVADLAALGAGIKVDPEQPYAELWMGVHPSGPSVIAHTGEKLGSWLERNPIALGQGVLTHYGARLPFLFKVLSVQTALSIQSHPDKVLAAQLHATRSDVYKDGNHKPEMALAVRDFEALCGFCTLAEIKAELSGNDELQSCVGAAAVAAVSSAACADAAQQRSALRQAFTALMTCPEERYRRATRNLHARLSQLPPSSLSVKDALFLRIFEQFPEDVGLLAIFFLNYLKLEPGEAMYLPANEPHAYLAGELIEAMASSDNVIRAGLTPKLRDTEVLCNSLTYHQGLPSILKGEALSKNIFKYQPPFEEFQILRFSVDTEGVVSIPPQQSPMILVVLEKQGLHSLQSTDCPVDDASLQSLVPLSRGTVLFVPAHTDLKLHSTCLPYEDEADERGVCSLLAYASTANDNMFVSAAEAASALYPSISDVSMLTHNVNLEQLAGPVRSSTAQNLAFALSSSML